MKLTELQELIEKYGENEGRTKKIRLSLQNCR